MKTQHSSHNNSFDPLIEFDNLYKGSVSKWFAIFVTIVNVITLTPLCFAIVWYERFRANGNRTLLNQATRLSQLLIALFHPSH